MAGFLCRPVLEVFGITPEWITPGLEGLTQLWASQIFVSAIMFTLAPRTSLYATLGYSALVQALLLLRVLYQSNEHIGTISKGSLLIFALFQAIVAGLGITGGLGLVPEAWTVTTFVAVNGILALGYIFFSKKVIAAEGAYGVTLCR